MDLLTRYRDTLASQGLQSDPGQETAIRILQQTASKLVDGPGPTGWLHLVRQKLGNRTNTDPVRGVYLWGGVGRGKTFIMDLFFEALPFEDKLRYHFHRLMYRVHRRLKELQHLEDPLQTIADEFSEQARVICFDEFFVSDIADAMIIGKLLRALFERQVTLVATSNITPNNLYHDGLQRQQFLPAISLIKQHTNVIELNGETDYRLRVLEQAEIFCSPLDDTAARKLASYFSRIAPALGTVDQPMEIHGRDIMTRQRAEGIVWFDFQALCDGPRSQDDYIEIARCFQTVILSEVPVMDENRDAEARRFIALVDEFYDRRVNLIISAETGITDLYTGARLAMEFERTCSRLLEMQSTDYLAAGHLP